MVLYSRVFEKDGTVKQCGRDNCIALIKACNKEFGGSFGDVATGIMDVEAISNKFRFLFSRKYRERAAIYAERHGIIEYDVVDHNMIYDVSYPEFINQGKYTIRHTVDLKDMSESTERLSVYNKLGEYNR